jgi:hypothetical protein
MNKPSITFVLGLSLMASHWAIAGSLPLEDQTRSRVTISLSILPSISIDTVADMSFDISRRDIDASYNEFFCVKGNSSTRYSILTYSNSSNQGSFSLTNSNGEELRYSVSYRGSKNSSQYDPLTPGEPSPVYSVLPGNDACDGQPNFNIKFLAVDLEDAASGLYSGALTLVVAPL